MYRRVSPIVKQDTPMHCYAAAFESWTRATPGFPDYTQQSIASTYDDNDPPEGGASEQSILNLLSDFNLDYTDWRKGQLTEELIASHLQDGLVVLIYKSSQAHSHTLVIYGVSHANGVAQISFMDPWYGAYRWDNVAGFNGKPWLLAWGQ
jgi:hypothetical protein